MLSFPCEPNVLLWHRRLAGIPKPARSRIRRLQPIHPFHIQTCDFDPMDSTLPRLLPPLPSLHHQRRAYRPKIIPGDHDGPGGGGRSMPARVRTTGRGGRNAGKFRAKGLFGAGGGGDGLRAVMRMVKLNSAIQNRSVRELLELVGDECLYFLGNLRSVDVSQLGKVRTKRYRPALILEYKSELAIAKNLYNPASVACLQSCVLTRGVLGRTCSCFSTRCWSGTTCRSCSSRRRTKRASTWASNGL
jgi:hypothetical protein